jgi:hypothetical protein
MEKISVEAKKHYADKIREFKQTVDEIQDRTRMLEGTVQGLIKSRGLPAAQYRPDTGVGLDVLREMNGVRFELAGAFLDLVSHFNLMNALSLSLLGIKNEGFLNEARKSCYKSIIAAEEAISPYVDAPFSDYQQGVESLDQVGDKRKFDLVRKLGFSIDSVIEGFGANSKWKWSFVELEGRYAVITKNLLNLKTFLAQLDPRIEGYSHRLGHMQLAKKLLQQSADRYREKYELSTMRLDDIKTAILFLAALRRLHTLLGEVEEAEVVKKKIEIWKSKMEDDQKKKESAARMAKVRRPSEG